MSTLPLGQPELSGGILGIGYLSGRVSSALSASRALPTMVVSRSRMPNIAQNIEDAIAAGHPDRLTRLGDEALASANRRAALRGQAPPQRGMSLDEYPFACTAQGGAGACVRSVPLQEQRIQGGEISAFFRGSNILPGDDFYVRVGP